MNTLETTINRNLITYAVQRHIFCPQCGHVLDVRSTVLISLTVGAAEKTYTLCNGCYSKVKLAMNESAVQGNWTIEVLDGGQLFARRRRSFKAQVNARVKQLDNAGVTLTDHINGTLPETKGNN